MKIAIIGAGAVGLAIGRELLKRRQGEVTIFEKETHLGMHASGNNSGVIHSGINHRPGSLKSQMCVKGSRMLREYCLEASVPMIPCGTWVVALKSHEIPRLHEVKAWGEAVGVKGLELTSIQQMKDHEILAKGLAALYSPEGAVLCTETYLSKLKEDIGRLGGQVILSACVHAWKKNHELIINQDVQKFDMVINAAGIHADHYAHTRSKALDFRMIPFWGDYRVSHRLAVKSMIYPVPDPAFPFLGVHLTRTVKGEILIGPGALIGLSKEPFKKSIDVSHILSLIGDKAFWKLICDRKFAIMARHFLKMRFWERYFQEQLGALIEVDQKEVLIKRPPGVRAQVVNASGQFVSDPLLWIEEGEIHILNVVSPGLTCSLAFAEWIVDEWMKKKN